MLAIVETNLTWKAVRNIADRENMNFVADWCLEPELFLETDVDEHYTMDDLVSDIKLLCKIGVYGSVAVVDTCLDYPLIKVSILDGKISTVAVHRDNLLISAFSQAQTVDLEEL